MGIGASVSEASLGGQAGLPPPTADLGDRDQHPLSPTRCSHGERAVPARGSGPCCSPAGLTLPMAPCGPSRCPCAGPCVFRTGQQATTKVQARSFLASAHRQAAASGERRSRSGERGGGLLPLLWGSAQRGVAGHRSL